MKIAIGVLFAVLGILLFVFIFRTVYYAFVQKKDERLKWIVTKSMAQSFIIVIFLQGLLTAVKLINNEFYSVWWPNFKQGIYVEPVVLSIIILGTVTFINKRKFGG